MELKRLIIVAGNGIRLYGLDLTKDNEFVLNKHDDLMKCAGLTGILQYCNTIMLDDLTDELADSLVINDLLWTIYSETVTHYQPKQHEIKWKVILISRIDLTVPIHDWKRLLLRLCKQISYAFYDQYKDEIDKLANIDLSVFSGFSVQVKEEISGFYNSLTLELGEAVESLRDKL